MKLRPMTMDDADFMLELKNYPETRRFAIQTTDEIKLIDHLKYIEKNIMFFRTIDGPNDRIGVVRVFANEISIWINRKYWGLGIATQIIKAVTKDKEGMFAKIVNGNIASFRAFAKAGFIPVGYSHVDKYYILQKP